VLDGDDDDERIDKRMEGILYVILRGSLRLLAGWISQLVTSYYPSRPGPSWSPAQ